MSRLVKVEVIERNSIQCLHCLEEIESAHRHDFKFCACETVAVDGGKDYRKRLFKAPGDFEDTSIYYYEMKRVDW